MMLIGETNRGATDKLLKTIWNMGRNILKILTCLWMLFWLFSGIMLFIKTPEQMAKDRKFIETKIKPSVDFVKNFKSENGRLPLHSEYYSWNRGFYHGIGAQEYIRRDADIPSSETSKFKGADWNKDFAIGVWRGEWMEYYFSWKDSYDGNNYSWKDSSRNLLISILLGLLPLAFWWVYFKNKRKTTY